MFTVKNTEATIIKTDMAHTLLLGTYYTNEQLSNTMQQCRRRIKRCAIKTNHSHTQLSSFDKCAERFENLICKAGTFTYLANIIAVMKFINTDNASIVICSELLYSVHGNKIIKGRY